MVDSIEALVPQANDAPTGASTLLSRTLHYLDVVMLRTDAHFVPLVIEGDCEGILGCHPRDIIGEREGLLRLVVPEDRRRFFRFLRELTGEESTDGVEVRVLSRRTGEVRWLLVRGRALRDTLGRIIGWEGCGVDVSAQRGASEALHQERKRLEALYEVARAVQLSGDPAVVALRGLHALARAIGADGGIVALAHGPDAIPRIAAAEGLSEQYLTGLAADVAAGRKNLLQHVMRSRIGVLIGNLQSDPRSSPELSQREGLRGAIVMPLIAEDIVVGALQLVRRRGVRYERADFELVHAVASQMAFAARQAEHLASERRFAGSLGALYRLSHELSKHLAPRDIAEHTFPIIQEELVARRMWLGTVNDAGTHVVGQGGFGPGIRQSLINLSVAVTDEDDFLGSVFRTREPLIVTPSEDIRCPRLSRVLARLSPGVFVVMPLVSLGQFVGVLIVEPAVPSVFFAQQKLPLLRSMAGEIATVMLARRFESRIAEAEKMRMAGHLASGVAHNFNNLLQAVMGQASLIEMQRHDPQATASSAKMIVEAASRGAGLVKQLLALTAPPGVARTTVSSGALLRDSLELYRSAVGAGVTIDFQIAPSLPQIEVDIGQFQQVMTNLLVNAREALAKQGGGWVRVAASERELRPGEIDPALPSGAFVRIDVEDNGPGMDDEQQRRCFEPFYTTKDVDPATGLSLSGAGLGLSSAYSIVRHLGGILTVQSELRRGTTFSLFLPSKGTATSDDQSEQATVLIAGFSDEDLAPFGAALDTTGLIARRLSERGDVGPARLLFLNLDAKRHDPLAILDRVRASSPELPVLAVSDEPVRWERVLSQRPGVELLRRPRGIWAVHALLRRTVRPRQGRRA